MCAVIIGAGVVATGAVVASLISSSAAGDAGQAQLSAAQMQVQLAQQQLQAQIQQRAQGIQQAQQASQMSPGEIASIQSILETQSKNLQTSFQAISQQQTQLDNMSPQLQAAGKDYYNLLTGQASAILAPLQQQQQYQRQNLENQLASQLGPGYMTSSAGIQALTQFDNQSAITLNQAQMNAIQTVGQQYGGLASMAAQSQYGITSQTQAALGQYQQGNLAALNAYQTQSQLQTNATLSAMGSNQIQNSMVPSAQGSVVGVAGNPFAGGAVAGQSIAQGAQGIGQLAGQYAISNQLANLGGGGSTTNPLSGQIASYQLPASPAFGSSIASGAYNPSLGAATSMPNIPTY